MVLRDRAIDKWKDDNEKMAFFDHVSLYFDKNLAIANR